MGRRPRAGAGFLRRGRQPISSPARGSGEPVSSTAGFGVDPWPPKGFPLFLTLRLASPDTIILFIVEYHAAKPPWPPWVRPCPTFKKHFHRSGHRCTWQRDAIQLLLLPLLLLLPRLRRPDCLRRPLLHPRLRPWPMSTLSSFVVGNVGNCPIVNSITKHDTHRHTLPESSFAILRCSVRVTFCYLFVASWRNLPDWDAEVKLIDNSAIKSTLNYFTFQ